MIDTILSFLGLDMSNLLIGDSVYFVVGSSIFLFAVAETFRLFEIVIEHLTRRR